MKCDARLILTARRPSGQDDADPEIAAALAEAGGDPALQAWLDAEQKIDAALTDKLRAVVPPPGLRDTILTGANVGGRGFRAWFEQPFFRGIRNSEMLAVAAVMLLLTVAVLWNRYGASEADGNWQIAAARQVTLIERGDLAVETTLQSLTAAREWLVGQMCPSPAALPRTVAGLRIVACGKIEWRGVPMGVVCFSLRGEEVHLVTVAREALIAAPPAGSPEFAEIGGFATASWSDGPVSMMLLARGPREKIEGLFAQAPIADPGRG